MQRLILLVALLALTGCATTSGPAADGQTCTTNDRARLSGLKMGSSLGGPDPTTERGQKVIAEIAALEAKCSPPATSQ